MVRQCHECEFLRRRHAELLVTHSELREQLRPAVQDGKGELVTAMIISEAAALKERDDAETALRRHEALTHGSGDVKGEAV
jgi:hypothetical protein